MAHTHSIITQANVEQNLSPFSAVGVMPPGIDLPGFDNWKDQLWVPIAFPSEEAQSRGNHYLEIIARMKPGVTLKQAKAARAVPA